MSTAVRRVAPGRAPFILAALLLTATVLLGGGGSPSPLPEAGVELIALSVFVAGVALGWRPLAAPAADPGLALLMAAILLFPLLQLLPLPPIAWHALPGRDGARAAFDAVGAGDGWQPWSLRPDATLAGALALMPAAVLAVLTAALPAQERVRLLGLLAMLGLGAALLGIVQFIGGEDMQLKPYAYVHRGWGLGFFANRNAQADLLAVAMTAGLLVAERHRVRLATPAGAGWATAGLLMLAGGVATGSRMGMVSLAVPVVLALGQAGRRAPGVALALGACAALLLVGGTALDRVAARAGDSGARTEIWGDSVFVARSVAPVGGGVGSFEPLYAAAEQLDHVQPTIANRAHNDWIELAIEGGVPALAVAAAVLALVGRRAVAGWSDGDPDRRVLARFAGLAALILASHSVVDYPLRTLTLLGVAALALAGLASGPWPHQKRNGAGNQIHADA